MKLHTFTGYAANDMGAAVADAHRDYDQWLSDNMHKVMVKESPIITATIRPADVEGGAEYWFTITITYREVRA